MRASATASIAALSGVLLFSTLALGQPNVKTPRPAPAASAVAADANFGTTRIQPANITVGSARNLVPDGTSLSDDWSDGADNWYVSELDRGKGYLLEVLDINDHNANAITVNLFEADGTTPLSTAEDVTCGLARWSPSFSGDGSATGDGQRCSIYMFANGVAPDTKIITIQAHLFTTTQPLRIRLRENNVISRWTTNGYDNFVALQNNTANTVTGWVLYYPTGAVNSLSYAAFDGFSLGPYDAVQYTHVAGSIASNRGMLRIAVTSGTDVNVQSYAFHQTNKNYLFFTPEKPNHGGANSW